LENEIIIRHYQPEDETSLLDVLRLSFSVWKNEKDPRRHWEWKYLETPQTTDVIVAIHNSKVVGVSHNLRLNLKLGSRIVLTHFGADSATHPDYRGRGIFGRIVGYLETIRHSDKIGLEYAFSGNPAVRKEWGKRGRVSFPFHVSYMLRLKDAGLHLQKKHMKNAIALRVAYEGLKTVTNLSKVNEKIEDKDKFKVNVVENFDDKIDLFWDRVKDNYDFIVEKKKKYLNWRYNSRAGDFKIFEAVQGDELLGFITAQVTGDTTYPEGQICDLLTLPRRTDVSNALMEAALSYLDQRGVNAVYYMVVRKNPYQRVAANNGFVDVKEATYITCHVVDTQKEFEVLQNSTPSRVYLNYSDQF
jgi:GNAT superfamily N-acetyltransferase